MNLYCRHTRRDFLVDIRRSVYLDNWAESELCGSQGRCGRSVSPSVDVALDTDSGPEWEAVAAPTTCRSRGFFIVKGGGHEIMVRLSQVAGPVEVGLGLRRRTVAITMFGLSGDAGAAHGTFPSPRVN